jgi:hypothetical protein
VRNRNPKLGKLTRLLKVIENNNNKKMNREKKTLLSMSEKGSGPRNGIQLI